MASDYVYLKVPRRKCLHPERDAYVIVRDSTETMDTTDAVERLVRAARYVVDDMGDGCDHRSEGRELREALAAFEFLGQSQMTKPLAP